MKTSIDFALQLGKELLSSGAETYRIETTIIHILEHEGLVNAQCFCIPTAIMLSVNNNNENISDMVRINDKSIDLEKISRLNSISRKLTANIISLQEAKVELEKLKNTPDFPLYLTLLGAGAIGGFFSLLYHGKLPEFIAALSISILVSFILLKMKSVSSNIFSSNLIGGFLNSMLALLFIASYSKFGIEASIDKIIIGSIMPLVPGVTFTNALRDSISGDFVSGLVRMSEAVLIAIAIAIGVGLALEIKLLAGGLLI